MYLLEIISGIDVRAKLRFLWFVRVAGTTELTTVTLHKLRPQISGTRLRSMMEERKTCVVVVLFPNRSGRKQMILR